MRVFGVTGRSGSGKTTLIEAMLPELMARGLRVSVVKHSHHDFPMEPEGKDSSRFRRAGAQEVMICSPHRYAIVRELAGSSEPSLEDQLTRLSPVDLVLVEGFRSSAIPRLEVIRPELGKEPYYTHQQDIVAIACARPIDVPLPQWPLNEPGKVAEKLLAWYASG